MAYPEKSLVPGEEIVLDLNPHWYYLAHRGLVLAAVTIVGLVTLVRRVTGNGWPTWFSVFVGVGMLAAIGWFLPRFLKWRTTNFIVTTERCIYRTGLVSHDAIEIPLDRINTVFVRQSVWERLIGAGDLAIESGGETGRQEFTAIMNPSRVQQAIYSQKELNEHRHYDRIGQEAAEGMLAASGKSASEPIPDQIRKLAELRDQGILSEQEFEAKKQDLLDRM